MDDILNRTNDSKCSKKESYQWKLMVLKRTTEMCRK